MATIRNQTMKLGIFVVAVAAILVVALFLIGGLHIWRPVHKYHVVTSEGTSGITLNSAVTMRGVAVGKVGKIELDDTDFARVRIELEIDPDVKLPAGSMAYFERVGLTGDRAVDITGGTLADGQLAPGSEIPRGTTYLENLQSRADELTDELSTALAELTEAVHVVKVLAEAVDPNRVADVVAAVDPERIEAIVANTERATRSITATSGALRRTVDEGGVHIEQITHDVDLVADKAATALEQADVAAKRLTRMLDDADTILKANRDDLRVTLINLRRISQETKALVHELREQPSLLLRSRRPKRPKRPKQRKSK